jgi:hypothetical protein
MKKLLVAAALAACSLPAVAQVGISVNVGDPGFFGQIDLGDAPPPQVVYNQPVIIQRDPGYGGGPVYLHVPPGRERNWRRYCGEYNACGRPVYFVRDDWYNSVYVPHYRDHRDHYDHGRGRYDDHGPDRHDDHGPDRGPDRGPDDRDHR